MELNIIKQWDEYKTLLLATGREGMSELIKYLEEQTDMRTAPASSRYHNNFLGGLVDHSLNVYYCAIKNTSLIELLSIEHESIVIAALLHDICKANYYTVEKRNRKNEQGQWEQYDYYAVDDRFPIGHGDKSIIMAQRFIKLNDVEIAMIRNHMSFTDKGYVDVGRLFALYPESLLIHFADMEACYIMEGGEDLLPEVQTKLKDFTEKGNN